MYTGKRRTCEMKEEKMRVVEVETPEGQRRYVVIDEDGKLIGPVVRYLKYLDQIGSARQTLRSYATALRLYWEFLSQQELDWQQITIDELAQFVTWLKLPTPSLKVLPAFPVEQARSNRTINHALTVVRSFYDYHWRRADMSMNLKDQTTTFLPPRTRRYKAFLHHISQGSPVSKNILKQKEDRRQHPSILTKEQVQELLDACANERDRLLIRLLYEQAVPFICAGIKQFLNLLFGEDRWVLASVFFLLEDIFADWRSLADVVQKRFVAARP